MGSRMTKQEVERQLYKMAADGRFKNLRDVDAQYRRMGGIEMNHQLREHLKQIINSNTLIDNTRRKLNTLERSRRSLVTRLITGQE